MASKSNNVFTRIKENVMGTKEENAQAEKDIAKYKASKAADKAKEKEIDAGFKEGARKAAERKYGNVAERASRTDEMGNAYKKGGVVKKATVKKAAGKTVKKPAIAVMIAVGKPKMAKGGMPKKKC